MLRLTHKILQTNPLERARSLFLIMISSGPVSRFADGHLAGLVRRRPAELPIQCRIFDFAQSEIYKIQNVDPFVRGKRHAQSF